MICFPCTFFFSFFFFFPKKYFYYGGLSWREAEAGCRKGERTDADTLLVATTDPMLMNAFNNVNLAAACIVTSAGFARELGVAEESWVYPLGGAGTRDSYDCECMPFFQPHFPSLSSPSSSVLLQVA